MSCFSCWPSTPPERNLGWRSGMRHSVYWEKLAEQVLRYFQEKILWAQFLHLLLSRPWPICLSWRFPKWEPPALLRDQQWSGGQSWYVLCVKASYIPLSNSLVVIWGTLSLKSALELMPFPPCKINQIPDGSLVCFFVYDVRVTNPF